MKRICLFIVLAINIISCQRATGPKQVLQEFIEYRYENNQTKEKILSYLAGSLAESVAELDGEALESYLRSDHLKLKSHEIVAENCLSDTVCNLTYVVKYQQKLEDNSMVMTEVKKIAEMIFVGSVWKISDVSNIKTHHDSKEVLTP